MCGSDMVERCRTLEVLQNQVVHVFVDADASVLEVRTQGPNSFFLTLALCNVNPP